MPFFAPVSAGGVPKATVTATTGSPTVDTSSRAGKTIYIFKFCKSCCRRGGGLFNRRMHS